MTSSGSPWAPPSSAAAGWYADPTTGLPRYFDGIRWADNQPATPAAKEPIPTLPFKVAVISVGLLALSLVAANLFELVADSSHLPLMAALVVGLLIVYGPSVVWIAIVRHRFGGPASGLKIRWSDLGWGPVIWIITVIIEVITIAILTGFDVPIESNVSDITTGQVSTVYLVLTVISLVVIAPVVEEAVFRGLVLHGLLSGWPAFPVILVQGILFGLAHFIPAFGMSNLGLVAVLSAVGVVLGTAAYLLRRIGATVIAHAIVNGVVVIVVWTGVFDQFSSLI